MEILLFGLDIGGWLEGTGIALVLGVIVTVLRKKGYIHKIKKFFGFMEKITKKTGYALLESSDAFGAMSSMISKDGKLKENSIDDVLREGKEAIMEWRDVIVVMKPKKELRKKGKK
ncbi:MAG: hypothetical protein ACQEQ0_13835 [Bacteroidota bacterium]